MENRIVLMSSSLGKFGKDVDLSKSCKCIRKAIVMQKVVRHDTHRLDGEKNKEVDMIWAAQHVRLSLCAREFLSPNFVRECMPRGGERRISEESDVESSRRLRDSC